MSLGFKNKKGFTLVELLAVIVILAIIMLIAIPAVLSTLSTAKRKGFVEYVDKVFLTTQKQVLEDDVMGKPIVGCKTYYIKKDLGLNSTGNYDGFVLVKNDGFNDVMYYITLHDDEYKIESYLYDGSLDVNNLLKYSEAEEINNELTCSVAGCSSCSSDENMSAGEVCSSITQVSDSTPGTFSGSGTSGDPYKIESIEDLAALAKGTNDGSLGTNKYYKLMVDLSFACDKSYADPTSGLKSELTSGTGWTPIGNSTNPFKSYIDGNSKKIYGLYANGFSGDHFGLIGYAKPDSLPGVISNISLLDANINVPSKYSSIAIGYVEFSNSTSGTTNTISNIKTSGTLKSTGGVSGAGVAYADGNYNYLIENIINNATINHNPSGYDKRTGGAIGYAGNGLINTVYNYGNIDVNSSNVGGAIGYTNYTQVNNIYNYGKISSGTASHVGGVIGTLSNKMSNGSETLNNNLYNYGSISGIFGDVGGVMGRLAKTIVMNAYNYGDITATQSNSGYMGGIVADLNYAAELYNVGNHGNLYSLDDNMVGGIVAYSEGALKNGYNYGNITFNRNNSSSVRMGTIVGYGHAVNCYSTGNINFNKVVSSDYIGFALGQNMTNKDGIHNIYTIGDLINTGTREVRKYDYYFGAIGNLSSSSSIYPNNIYTKGKIVGVSHMGAVTGYLGSSQIENIYIDINSDADEVQDARGTDEGRTITNYYTNVTGSSFTRYKSSPYDFSKVNGMWFRDTLKLGNYFKYQDGLYPKVYKILPNGHATSELVEGQKDIFL